MKLRAMVLAFALAACGQTGEQGKAASTPEAIEPFDLSIEIGRYGVMLDQTANLTAERPGAIETAPDEPVAMARALRETVWQYNLTRSRLCGRGLFTDVACGPVYEPVWISEPETAAPTLEDLKARADAVGAEVMRFWNAVCEDARTRVTDEQERMYVCAIE
jgi:hypothetical protein